MLERCQKNPKIKFALNQDVAEIITSKRPPLNQDALSGLKLKNSETGAYSVINVEGLFVAIGHQPNTTLFSAALPLDEKGYIKTQSQSSRTEIPGVFACGDVQDSIYRQAITAAGSGCMAAIDAERFLEHQGL